MSVELFEGRSRIFEDKKGYKLAWINGRSVKLHVLVWERANGSKPKGYEIHHIDHDKGNFCLENLELLSHSEHQRVHAGWLKTDGTWSHKPCTKCNQVLSLSCFYPRKGLTPSAKCKACHIEITREWAKRNKAKRRKIALDYYHRNKAGGKNHARG